MVPLDQILTDEKLPGVATPQIPGDVSLVGNLEAAVVAQLAPRYKGWLYLNPEAPRKGTSPSRVEPYTKIYQPDGSVDLKLFKTF